MLEIRREPFVKAVDHDITLQPTGFWNKERIAAKNQWEMGSNNAVFIGNGEGVFIFVVDTGIDDHVEFGNRIDRGLSRAFGERTDTYDCLGHGTKVAGVSAGTNTGIAKEATIVSYAVMTCDTGGTMASVIDGALLSLATDMITSPELKGKKIVVNLSNGPGAPADTREALIKAEQSIIMAGGVLIRAAGNNGEDACEFGQKNLVNSLSVGSIDKTDKVSSFSNTGSCVDIYAPGEDIRVPEYNYLTTESVGYGVIS
eukprot:Awhi_evm1s7876